MQTELPLSFVDQEGHIAAIDQLIRSALAYDTPERLRALFEFSRRLPAYSPFNCLLLHIQKPDALYVAPLARWKKLNRHLKPGARPLLILAPMHPVMFVFDVTDTVGPELPLAIREALDAGFSVAGEVPPNVWKRLLHQCRRGRIQVESTALPSTHAGSIHRLSTGFRVQLNASHTVTQQFATLVHELGHLFCGHLGSPNAEVHTQNRGPLTHQTRELEAEAVAWLVCQRCGVWPDSAHYLSAYLKKSTEFPAYSLDAILVAAGHVEQMVKGRLPPILKHFKTAPGRDE